MRLQFPGARSGDLGGEPAGGEEAPLARLFHTRARQDLPNACSAGFQASEHLIPGWLFGDRGIRVRPSPFSPLTPALSPLRGEGEDRQADMSLLRSWETLLDDIPINMPLLTELGTGRPHPGVRKVLHGQMPVRGCQPSGALAKLRPQGHSSYAGMKTKANDKQKVIELGQYIVSNPRICHGKPTFRGTRIMVFQVLNDVAKGKSWDFISKERWGGRIPLEAIAEAVRLAQASFLDENGRLLPHATDARAKAA